MFYESWHIGQVMHSIKLNSEEPVRYLDAYLKVKGTSHSTYQVSIEYGDVLSDGSIVKERLTDINFMVGTFETCYHCFETFKLLLNHSFFPVNQTLELIRLARLTRAINGLD